jgi:two-component system CheB/CheR fusion protein
MKGPDIALRPKAAESFSLALHELATNAVKHGALTAKEGRIRVQWRLEDGEHPALYFEWLEQGLKDVGQPTRRGFGIELLTRFLPYDLGARTEVQFKPTGLKFMMQLPVTHLAERSTADR